LLPPLVGGGGVGLHCESSSVFLFDVDVLGGTGVSAASASDGGVAALVIDGEIFESGTTIRGGKGGDGTIVAGAGGNGLTIGGTSRALGGSFMPGAGGLDPGGSGIPGVPVLTTGNG